MNYLLFPFALTMLFASGSNLTVKSAAKKFDGKFYDSTQVLDLSDDDADDINRYYGDIGAKTGKDLMSYLYGKIACPTSELSKYYLTYGSGLKGVGQWYQITDRNWTLSEPVNVKSFKFVTSGNAENAGSFYLYNMYISDDANANEYKAYSNAINGYSKDETLTEIDYVNHKKPNSATQVDKEHVWAKNHGFKVKDNRGADSFVAGAPTDLHHLVAADHNTNSAGHNDHFYGEVDHSKATVIYNYLADGSSEISGWLDTAKDTFEPTDEWKGDIARCLLYMATRYSVRKTTNTQAEPYLCLTDDTSYSDDSNDAFHGVQYNLSTLLKWNESDPVSDYEIHRNNLIYHNVQNNRNPFVDHPEWARRVYDTTYTFTGNTEPTLKGTKTNVNVVRKGDGNNPKTSAPTSGNNSAGTSVNTSEGTSVNTSVGTSGDSASDAGSKLPFDQKTLIIIVAAVAVIVVIAIIILAINGSKKKKRRKPAGSSKTKSAKKPGNKSTGKKKKQL